MFHCEGMRHTVAWALVEGKEWDFLFSQSLSLTSSFVLRFLGILYLSAELVAVTAGGDKGCQNEIMLPLERPFTGQHS